MPEKRLTLNSEKRKAIADVFQNHFEQNSPKKKLHTKAIVDYNEARTKMKVLANTVVRHHQPQEDVDTIRSMIAKYNSSGGELYNDNCFYFTAPPRMSTDYDGNPKEVISLNPRSLSIFSLFNVLKFSNLLSQNLIKFETGFKNVNFLLWKLNMYKIGKYNLTPSFCA